MSRPPKAPRTGIGALTVARDRQVITFSLLLSAGHAGRRAGKGSVTGEAELLRQAFRAGDCRLTLDDGAELEIAIVAHTEGGETAYFELR